MSGRTVALLGNDAYRLESRVRELLDELVPGDARAVGLETLDGRVDGGAAVQVVSACLQALQSVSLFGGNRVVWLRDAVFLAPKSGSGSGNDDEGKSGAAKKSDAKDGLAALASCVKNGIPDGVAFLLTAPDMDRRSSLYRAFDAAGQIELLQISDKPWEAEKQARAFLDERVRAQGMRISEDARRALLERTGADTLILASELEKLALYAGDRAVNSADVMVVTAASREAIVWELTDAIGERDVGGAFGVMRQLLFQGESPMALIAVLEGYFRQIAVAREVLDRKMARPGYRALEWRDLDDAESALLGALGKMDLRKMNPYRAMKLVQQASGRSAANIMRCRRAVVAAHERLVSSSVPQPLTLDLMLCQLLA